MKLVFNPTTGNFDYVASTAADVGITLPLSSANGGTGVNNAGTLTNASNTAITGGGTLALGGFTLTVPVSLTPAGLAVANIFTAKQQLLGQTATGNGGFVVGIGAQLLSNYQSQDTGGITYIYFTTNRALNNNAWESTGFYSGRKGGSFQVEDDAFVFYQFPASSNVPTKVFYIPTGGGIVVGAPASIVFSVSNIGVVTFVNDQWHVSKDTKKRLYFGNNSTSYFGSPAGYVWRNSADNVDLLTLSNVGLLTQVATTTTTNAVMETARLQAIVSTAATGSANGFGTGLSWYAETATQATNQQQGLISTSWIDATNASRKAKMSLSAYDTAARLGLEIEASGTAAKLGFFGGTTAIQQVLAAYTSDGEGAAYTGIDNLQIGTVYATVADLNQLRVAYETLRASYDDLRTKLQTSTLVA